MSRYRVPVMVTTTHYFDIDVPDGLGPVVSSSMASDAVRRMAPEQVRRTMPIGTTAMVGTPELVVETEPAR